MELQTVNKLFLELSQFATATTAKELKLQKEIDELKELITQCTDGYHCRNAEATGKFCEGSCQTERIKQHRKRLESSLAGRELKRDISDFITPHLRE